MSEVYELIMWALMLLGVVAACFLLAILGSLIWEMLKARALRRRLMRQTSFVRRYSRAERVARVRRRIDGQIEKYVERIDADPEEGGYGQRP